MTTALRYITIIFSTFFLLGKTFAQDTTTTNFLDQIKTCDLSVVLTADSILTEYREGGKDTYKRAEILGFIGDEYQRFFIHFVSVIQNSTIPYEYLVYGKTKVKETIRSFQGTITIRESRISTSDDIPTYKQGFAVCDVILYEDKKHSSTGFIKGKLKSKFVIDNKGHFRYDGLMFVGDGFSNNQFVGSWTSYKTNAIKKCHWGEYRIPYSGDLDIGAGEFSVDDKYLKYGWANYSQAYGYNNQNELATKKALQKEQEEWWK